MTEAIGTADLRRRIYDAARTPAIRPDVSAPPGTLLS